MQKRVPTFMYWICSNVVRTLALVGAMVLLGSVHAFAQQWQMLGKLTQLDPTEVSRGSSIFYIDTSVAGGTAGPLSGGAAPTCQSVAGFGYRVVALGRGTTWAEQSNDLKYTYATMLASTLTGSTVMVVGNNPVSPSTECIATGVYLRP